MEASGRKPDPPLDDLEELFFSQSYYFEFFQAVRLLERLKPDLSPVGRHHHPCSEVARFTVDRSIHFPPNEIRHAKRSKEPRAPWAELGVSFMGLTGPLGVLPIQYSLWVADEADGHRPLGDFLDLFNHRLISFFYRAWEKYRFPVAFERESGTLNGSSSQGESAAETKRSRASGVDTFTRHLYSMIGMGTEGMLDRVAFRDQSLLYYAGLLAQRPHSVSALKGILEDYFEVPIDIRQFTGQWFEMNPSILTSLGCPGRNSRLGAPPGSRSRLAQDNAVLWQRYFDPHARFEVEVGPLNQRQFRDFLPSKRQRNAYRKLVQMTRFIAGEEYGFSIRLIVEADEAPDLRLGGEGGAHLGWSAWLKEARPAGRDFQLRQLSEDSRHPVLSVEADAVRKA